MFWSSIIVFIVGTCIGSFLNVVLFRTHDGDSIARGRSRCRVCKESLRVVDLVPVLSYLFLRGRCRFCREVISWQYPAVELVTGVLFVLINQKFDWGLVGDMGLLRGTIITLRDWVFVSFLIIIFVYDLRHMLIIDRFIVPAMVLAVVLNLWLGLVPAWSILLGGIVLAGFFWLQFIVSKGTWVGGGDIRMGALMGFMLGLEQGLVALFLAYILGAIVGVVMMASGKATRKTQVPFGSFLAVATFIALFAGESLLASYLHLFL